MARDAKSGDEDDLRSIGVFVAIVSGTDVPKILLVKHSYGRQGWSLPGGGLKKGESIVDGAIREADEESGYRIHKPKLITVSPTQTNYGEVCLLFPGGHRVIPRFEKQDDEISEIKFFSISGLISGTLKPEPEIYPPQLSLVHIVNDCLINPARYNRPWSCILTVPPSNFQQL